MFYADHTPLEVAGQLMIATLFLGTLAINATTKVQQHVDRMAAMGIPLPRATLWAGFALQGVGGGLDALAVEIGDEELRGGAEALILALGEEDGGVVAVHQRRAHLHEAVRRRPGPAALIYGAVPATLGARPFGWQLREALHRAWCLGFGPPIAWPQAQRLWLQAPLPSPP